MKKKSFLILKKSFLIFLCIVPLVVYSKAKFPIDTSYLKSFKTLMYSSSNITNNGKFIIYSQPNSLNAPTTTLSLIFKSLNSSWQMIIDSITGPYQIADNSKYVIFKKINKGLGVLELGTGNIEYIPDVEEFRIVPEKKMIKIAFTTKKDSNLAIVDIESKKKIHII